MEAGPVGNYCKILLIPACSSEPSCTFFALDTSHADAGTIVSGCVQIGFGIPLSLDEASLPTWCQRCQVSRAWKRQSTAALLPVLVHELTHAFDFARARVPSPVTKVNFQYASRLKFVATEVGQVDTGSCVHMAPHFQTFSDSFALLRLDPRLGPDPHIISVLPKACTEIRAWNLSGARNLSGGFHV